MTSIFYGIERRIDGSNFHAVNIRARDIETARRFWQGSNPAPYAYVTSLVPHGFLNKSAPMVETSTFIRMAYSRQKSGFTVFSCERTPSLTHGLQKSGGHITMADTLEEAKRDAMAKIDRDWRSLGLEVPPIYDMGKVSDIVGRNHSY